MNGGNLPFSTDVQVGHSMYGNTYNDEYTKVLANLTYTGDGTPFSDYALGYIKTDDLPDVYRRTKVDFDPGGDSLKFDYATPDGNYPCGYMSTQGQSLPTYFSECTWRNGTLVRHGQCQQWRFINNCYPELSELGPAASSKNFQLILRGYYYMRGNDTPINLSNINIDVDDLEYFKGLISSKGVQNTYHYTTTVTYSGTTYNIDLPFNFDTFADIEVHVEDVNESGIYFNGFIVGYSFVTSNCMNFFVVEVPEIDSEGGYNRKWIVGGMRWAGTNAFMTIDGTNQNNITATYTSTSHNMNNTNTGAFGGLQGEFPVTSIGGVANNLTYLTKSGNVGCFRQQGLNNIHYIHRIFRTQEIEELLDIALYRESVNNISSTSYTVGRSSAIQVDSDDRFRAEQKEGNISDEAFKGGLRDWQYIDPDNDAPEDNGFDQNDFDPDNDIPEYTPDPPAPDEDIPDDENPEDISPEEKGDEGDVPFNTATPPSTSGFLTMYALAPIEVEDLGVQLWGSVNSQDPQTNLNMLKNFFALNGTNTTDYELSCADIFNYVISLKWYPFSVPAVAPISPITNLIIGSGTAPFSTPGRVLTKNMGYIPAGNVKIDWPTNTFIDLEPNTEISIFVPFCGTLNLPPSQVYGRTISLDYLVDFTTGACTAYIKAAGTDGTYPIGTLNGTMGFDILLTGNNAQTVAARAIQNNNTYRLNAIQETTSGIVKSVGQLVSKDVLGAFSSISSTLVDQGFDLAKQTLMQPTLQGVSPLQTGSITTLSSLGYIEPFIQIRRHPMFNKGAGYNSVGYVSDRKMRISDIKSGTFFQAVNPNLQKIKATKKELQTIASALANGCFK